jgi:F-type H+-transporting ATPase subunit alpha
VLWAVQNNFLDDVDVDKVKDCQSNVTEFLTTRKAELLKKIRAEKAISDALAGELKTAMTEFKQTYNAGKPKETATAGSPAPTKPAPQK